MDTVRLVLLALLLVTTLLIAYGLWNNQKPQKVNADNQWIRKMATEQILENRRLINLILSNNPAMFHQITAVNPENMGSSQLTKSKTPTQFLDSEGIPDREQVEYPLMDDQGFDEAYH